MRKNLIQTFVIGLASMVLVGCGGSQKATVDATTTATEPRVIDTTAVVAVEVNKEFLSIEEAVQILQSPEEKAAIMKKYGYKYKKGYEVSRMDKYDEMYYKNCKLPRMLRDGVYENYPQPLVKGISSYVAFTNRIEIGVFNMNAYNNLVAQVKAGGFRLVEDGYEAEYSNGAYNVYCYEGGKRVRIQKAQGE